MRFVRTYFEICNIKNIIIMTDFETNIFKIVDDELDHLLKEKYGATIKFEIYTTEGQQALEIIQNHNLITFRDLEINNCIADISLNGRYVITSGGIKKYLNNLREKVLQKENKEELELEKIKKEIILLKNQLGDYRTNKWIALLALIISVSLAILELLKFLTHK